MPDSAYDFVITPITKAAKQTVASAKQMVACAPFVFFSPQDGAAMATDEYAILDTPQSGHIQRIGLWGGRHDLTEDETERLKTVLTDYPEPSISIELEEELRCILADRKLARMPKLTAADADKARHAFESGLLPFVRQVVD